MSSRPSFNKRQKEHARKEKQRMKAERKQQRKQEKDSGVVGGESDFGSNPDFGIEAPALVPAEGHDS